MSCEINKCPFFSERTVGNKKIIHFDLKLTKELQNNKWNEFAEYLKEAFKIDKLDTGTIRTIVVSESVLKCLDEWLNLSINKIQEERETLDVVLEILRALRNSTCDRETQNCIVERTSILITANNLFSKVFDIDKSALCLKILFQFLVNLASSNEEATTRIYEIYYDKIKACLNEQINVYESSALLYNISLVIPSNDENTIHTIFDLYNSVHQNEFLTFLLENNLANREFWDMYKDFRIEYKITTLEMLKDMQIGKRAHNLPLVGLEQLINVFLTSSDIVFQVKSDDTNLKVYEISLILEIISSLSGDEIYLELLQDNKNILIQAGVLLINVHRLGKLSDNCFTPVQKLSEFGTNNEELNKHPAFAFKADLIRLIGNLCWKSTKMQNLARTAELIPVILDCCNMDARNPFIIQWAILAIRNLCKNNQENQNLIAGLHQQGTVSSETIDEIGITLHDDGENQLKIVSLSSLKK